MSEQKSYRKRKLQNGEFMKKLSLVICFTILLGLGSLNVIKAGGVAMAGSISSLSGLEKVVIKTSNIGLTKITAHRSGEPDLLKLLVMQNANSYRQSEDIVVKEGNSAEAYYYAGAPNYSGLGLKLRLVPNSYTIGRFPVDTYVNFN